MQQYSSENSAMPVRWWNAFKIICLVFGILSALGVFTSLIGLLVQSGISELFMQLLMADLQSEIHNTAILEEFFAMFANVMNMSYIIALISGAISTAIYFLIFYGLNKYKPIGLYAVYAFNIFPIISLAISIPVLNATFKMIGDMMNLIAEEAAASTDVAMMNATFSVTKNVSIIMSIVFGLIWAGVLCLNTKYFHKRRHLFAKNDNHTA